MFVIAFTSKEVSKAFSHFIPSFLNKNILIGTSIIKVIIKIIKKYIIKYGLINSISCELTQGNQKTPSQPPFNINDNTNPRSPLTRFEIVNLQKSPPNLYCRFSKKKKLLVIILL